MCVCVRVYYVAASVASHKKFHEEKKVSFTNIDMFLFQNILRIYGICFFFRSFCTLRYAPEVCVVI